MCARRRVQSLETREEVEALLGLIQRLQLNSDGSASPGLEGEGGVATTVAPGTSTAALFKQLSAAAGALG